jgi:transcriptional regulator with XRE-family HTH domain
MSIKNRLKQIRNSTGLSQVKFSERIAVSSSYIADMELGKKPVNERILRLICAEYGVSENWFRTGVGEMDGDEEAIVVAEVTSLFKSLPPKSRGLATALLKTLAEHQKG